MLPYAVADANRRFPMGLPAGVFAPAVMVVGRLRDIMTLVCHGLSARICCAGQRPFAAGSRMATHSEVQPLALARRRS